MSTPRIQNADRVKSTRIQSPQPPSTATRILLAGSGRAAVAAASRISAANPRAVICGIVDSNPQRDFAETFPEIPWLGTFDALAECVVAHCADELHIALPLHSFAHRIVELQSAAQDVGARVALHLDFGPWVGSIQPVVRQDALVITSKVHGSLRGWNRIFKRALDVAMAGTAILLLLPLLLIIALAIAITSRGPVLFRQERVGRGQRVFQMLKFRSMVHNAEELRATVAAMNDARGISFKVFADPRVTRIGALLRRSSLDELPQLWNVLCGDMSLVGPRPIPVWVADQLQDVKSYRRFSVQPGLTGLWQVEGRQQDFDWMAMQDLRYIDTWSILLDLRILLATVPAMLRGEGAH